MKPLVCEALFATKPSLVERILRWIPFLGWALAAALEERRFRLIALEIEQQLLARPSTTLFWQATNWDQEVSKKLRPLLAEEFGWPNDHFLPDDPFGLVFWAHQDGLDDIHAIRDIEDLFDVKLSVPELKRLWKQGTLGEFVCLLTSLNLPNQHSLPVSDQS